MKLAVRAALSIAGLLLGGCTSTGEVAPQSDDAELTWNDGPRVPL